MTAHPAPVRNWLAISRIRCHALRLALGVCSNAEELQRLAEAFPDCFQETEYRFPVPFSMILAASKSEVADRFDVAALEEWQVELAASEWDRVVEQFGIPKIGCWELGAPVPPELAHQLCGRPWMNPTVVWYGGLLCVVACDRLWGEPDREQITPEQINTDDNYFGHEPLVLVPYDAIDFGS